MEKLLLLLTLIIVSNLSYSQKEYSYKEGYAFMRQAQKEINSKNISKANKLISKAKNANYGFCGNAWASVRYEIDLLYAQIQLLKNKPDSALKILDKLNVDFTNHETSQKDSLTIISLFSIHGKEKVIQAFKEVELIQFDDNENLIFVSQWINLETLNYRFNLKLHLKYFFDKQGKQKDKLYFKDIANDLPFYKLLK